MNGAAGCLWLFLGAIWCSSSDAGAVVLPSRAGPKQTGIPGCRTAARDTDCDGLPDAVEDANGNGRHDAGESAIDRADTDSDGLPDNLEDRNGNGRRDFGETSAVLSDSDGDGLSDSAEDVDQDGLRGVGETDPGLEDSDGDGVGDGLERFVSKTDPNVPDVLPGEHYFNILPEPLHFDLVRGLTARQGEVEINTMASWRGDRVHWAPEIEWAFTDGAAVELEVPMEGNHLHAIKAAIQSRLPWAPSDQYIHGVQVIVEAALQEPETKISALWIGAWTPSAQWSLMVMAGARSRMTHGQHNSSAWIANPSIFFRTTPRLVMGVETNISLTATGPMELLVLPQLHWEPVRGFRLQVGMGGRYDGDVLRPEVSGRAILELG